MLVLSRKLGQSFFVGEDIEITIIDVSGETVRIGIEAPRDVRILREELRKTIEQNKEAAGSLDPSFLRKLKIKKDPDEE